MSRLPARLHQLAKGAYEKTRRAVQRVLDPRRIRELDGERMVFEKLSSVGYLDSLEGQRVLEVGPKHGEDTRLLASLDPEELVLVDLPEKRDRVESWLPSVREECNVRFVEGNLLYMSDKQLEALGSFDLVWFLGVLYHNVEQVRLLRRVFDLCNVGGSLVLESSTTRDPALADKNVVEVHWPEPYRGVETMIHHPSRKALESWMEMVGFRDIQLRDVYSKHLAPQRAVLTGEKTPEGQPYVYYSEDERNETYEVGGAT